MNDHNPTGLAPHPGKSTPGTTRAGFLRQSLGRPRGTWAPRRDLGGAVGLHQTTGARTHYLYANASALITNSRAQRYTHAHIQHLAKVATIIRRVLPLHTPTQTTESVAVMQTKRRQKGASSEGRLQRALPSFLLPTTKVCDLSRARTIQIPVSMRPFSPVY